MVICYSAKELTAIGEKVILNELLNRLPMGYGSAQSNKLNCYQLNFQPYQHNSNAQQINSSLAQLIAGRELEQQSADNQQEQLSSSVAEFFKKAEQNFYAQASIDPTKVRRLSEIEAEIIGSPRQSC